MHLPRTSRLLRLKCLLVLLTFACAAPALAQSDPSLKTPDAFPRFAPVEPRDAAGTFQVKHGFSMQLIAAEPLVTDPVAMAIDEDGRAYVVEMNDYPYTNAKEHRPWQENMADEAIGRVRLLEDTDGDGVYDKASIFAEGLSWPSGVVCSRGGIYVTATPDIWYFKDTDGDRRADVREKLFTGFRKYNVQAVMNNPIWGLDNCIYVAGSSNGGQIRRVVGQGSGDTKAEQPLVARGDFRIDPRRQSLELQAGGARFGNTFDDWGNRFLCNIRNPAMHVVLDNRYLARNPSFAAPTAVINVAESGDQMPIFRISPIEPWRDLRGRQWSADPTKKLPRSELTGGGVFTSTSGLTVYRSAAYPAEYRGQMFEGEVANNVIYRQLVKTDGNTFQATRADQNSEFVASTDTWFRPVNFINAPDGTLYVLDMYREFIEHPWSIPDDIHARLDLTSGRDRGRIYRLAPPGFQLPPQPKLSQATTAELVATLGHAGSWWRETAQRLLVERGDRSAVHALRQHLVSSNALAALHSLWVLAGMEALRESDLTLALQHPSARIREHAVRLTEGQLADRPQLLKRVCELVGDHDSRVRLQVALTLGDLNTAHTLESLKELAISDGHDVWVRSALCSTQPVVTDQLLIQLLMDERFLDQPHAFALLQQLTETVGAAGGADSIAAIIPSVDNKPSRAVATSDTRQPRIEQSRLAVWFGLANVARRKGISLHQLIGPESLAQIRERIRGIDLLERSASQRQSTVVAGASEVHQVAATIQLTLHPFDEASPALMRLIDPLEQQAVQLAAVRGLASYKHGDVAKLLIAKVPQVTPLVREEILNVLLERPERTLTLLESIQQGKLRVAQLGLARTTQIISSKNAAVQKLAQQVLTEVESSRAAVIERYLPALAQVGDSAKGKAVFVQHCAACHRAGGLGVEIGPHLETVRGWDRMKLLVNILDPNREVAPGSMAYAIATADGKVLTGMITDETANSLTVLRAAAPPETVARQDIEHLSNTGQSLMPVGIEESVSPSAMMDLIAFLQSSFDTTAIPAK